MQPDDGSGKVNEGGEVSGSFAIARSYSPVMLEFAEETLYAMPFSIESKITLPLRRSILLRRDNNFCTQGGDSIDNRVAVVALIGKDSLCRNTFN